MAGMGFRFLFSARVADHRNVPGLGPDDPPHPAPPITDIHHRGSLFATPASIVTSIADHTAGAVVVVAVIVVVVVVGIVLPRFTSVTFRLQIQTVQFVRQVIVAAVLVRIVAEVTLRAAGAERILILQLFALTAVVQVGRPGGGPRGGLPIGGGRS